MSGLASRSGVDLAIVGHLARNEDRTPLKTKVSNGGAAYYCAVGAAVLPPHRVGIVAAVGADYDEAPLRRLGVDLSGVKVIRNGMTPRFVITQYPDGSRSFEAKFGVANRVHLDAFPSGYIGARYVHVATAPPLQQLAWLRWLHRLSPRPSVSVDCFEQFARDEPERSCQVCREADLVFMNEEEYCLLGGDAFRLEAPLVLKRGNRGVSYYAGTYKFHVPVTPVVATDSTGAGDVLAGVFLALRVAGLSLRDALREGAGAARASVCEFGVDSSILSATLQSIRDRLMVPVATGHDPSASERKGA